MAAQQRSINMEFLFRAQRAPRIEFWRKNDDGTCTRIADGLTVSAEDYDRMLLDVPLPAERAQKRCGIQVSLPTS